MEARELKRGDVVQLSPTECRNPMFAGCMLLVTEPKSFGAMGFVQSLGEMGLPGGAAYYRPRYDEMEYVGSAVWVPKHFEESDHGD